MQEFLAAIPDRHTLDVRRLQERKCGLENPPCDSQYCPFRDKQVCGLVNAGETQPEKKTTQHHSWRGEELSRSPWLVIPGNPRPVVRAEWDRRQPGSIVKSRRRVGLPGIAGRLRIRDHGR